tara:strand:- start:6 stop:284 length:279 start_codon:yes stop_codon:yes gene_type:complete
MMTYLVIGICLILLIIVVYISAKPISMGIEARRNIKENSETDEHISQVIYDEENPDNSRKSISTEILKLNELKNKGLLTDEEYEKAKNKILN